MTPTPISRSARALAASFLALAVLLSGCALPAVSETSPDPTVTESAPGTAEALSPKPEPEETASDEPAPEESPVPDEPLASPEPEELTAPTDISDPTAPSANYAAAAERLGQLAVKGRAPKTGYDRKEFGQAWADVDRNGCDTRNDILRRDLAVSSFKPGTRDCKVLTGTLADPYTGTAIEFDSATNASGVQIDHVVALSDAWQKGAQRLTLDERTAFANDPLNLRAVEGAANQQKSDSDAASWLPKNKSFRCEFVTTQIDVKAKYGLWVTPAEQSAMAAILQGCSGAVPVLAAVPVLGAVAVVPMPETSKPTAPKPAAPKGDPGPTDTEASATKDPNAGVAPESKTTCPESAPIKGNQTKKAWIYHAPGESSSYGATHPERCFATADEALRAGYRAPRN